MNGAGAVDSDMAVAPPPRRRKPVVRSVILLVVTAAALIVFILALGDMRRKRTALAQAKWYAAELQHRVAEGGMLPLNLQLNSTGKLRTKTYAVEWLSPQDVRVLRNSDRRLIVAQTVPISCMLGPDGRAVIFFRDGRFDCEWMTASLFDQLAATQRTEIRRRGARPVEDTAEPP